MRRSWTPFDISLALGTALLFACSTPVLGDEGATGEPTIQVGLPAPPLALMGLDGEVYDLAEAVARGPKIVIFFRGAW